MGPRWKGKGAEAKAHSDPMSKIISQLQSSLLESTNSHGLLSGCVILLEVGAEQAELLSRACFGRPTRTAQEENNQWFQLTLEEAFYLSHSLKCLKILDEEGNSKNDDELWKFMKSKRETFPYSFKVYSHLRDRNWVVRSGAQYGVDYVAYRHHPSMVHSEYAVLVLYEKEDCFARRLRVWSDYECAIRLCGSVAKTLLAIHVNSKEEPCEFSSCLENFYVEERTITRWSAEQRREDGLTGMK
ncbi:tRNA-splicing endonuclease subunit Sen2-2-like [Impatiens glandulifera]|uniref:tRNA-splicing endonuclease subunit Sen2-2-like n=1 Tax=Impatiens glandulifera TaxID=253017 RepID=UPI001FB05022|nr:tRNA-splicing endonuclease subunit Sen2-2-like [Impatiens glandulifera]